MYPPWFNFFRKPFAFNPATISVAGLLRDVIINTYARDARLLRGRTGIDRTGVNRQAEISSIPTIFNGRVNPMDPANR
jgi:hypothetical protein